MNNLPGQIPLNLLPQSGAAREDLVVSPVNAMAVEFLDSWPTWPTPLVILAGPVGAGKSHLAKIWADRSGASYLEPNPDEPLPDLGDGKYFVVDGLDRGNIGENWLFHVINSVRAQQGGVILTSRLWPGEWGISLPDLTSRLKTAHLVELNEPDDALLHGVLIKLFSDRQLQVESQVIDYLVTRMERSLASAQDVVKRLDALSLATKRSVTRSLAARALEDGNL